MRHEAPLWWTGFVLAIVVTAAAPAHASGPEDASCGAPFEGHALSVGAAPKASWTGVATSRSKTEVIAVWSETHVAISRDDGRTFQRLHATFENIEDVVLGAGGTVFVLDGGFISMAFARGHLRRVPVPQTYQHAGDDIEPENIRLSVGGGYLAFVSRAAVALTKDYGASWQIKNFPDGWADEVQLAIEPDGTLDAKVTVYNCHSGDYDMFYRGSPEAPWAEIEGSIDWLGHKLGYDEGHEDDAALLYSVDASGQRHVVHGLFSTPTLWPAALIHNERHDYARFRDHLYRLGKARAELLTTDVPEDLRLMAADGCERLVGLYKNRVVRWSPSTGWRQLDIVSP
jgi:hypothetical protein